MTFIKQKLIGKLDTSTSPVGLWNFESNLNDSSGNGFTLTGTPVKYTSVIQDFIKGVVLPGATAPAVSFTKTKENLLTISGAITLEIIGTFFESVNLQRICEYGDAGETLATNFLYVWTITANKTMHLLWESGAGVNREVTGDTAISVGIPVYLVCTRTDDNPSVVNFYINGLSGGSGSATHAEGGTSATSVLAFGGSRVNDLMVQRGSVVSSFRISPSALSAEKIKSTYNECLAGVSPFYPYLP